VAYVCVGVINVEVPPSPKLQKNVDVERMRLVLSKKKRKGVVVSIASEKRALQSGVGGTRKRVSYLLAKQPCALSEIESKTTLIPPVVYVLTGFLSAEVVPSPKFHKY
jgi:hypothetical protein